MGRNIQQNIKQNVQQIYILLCGFQSTNSDRFSGDGYEDPPVPISNTVVKLINAESTWLETAWEVRSLPVTDLSEKRTRRVKLIGKQVVCENGPRARA